MNVHGRYGIEAELLRGTNAATLLQVSWFIFYLQVSRRSILRAEHFLLSEQVLQAGRNRFGKNSQFKKPGQLGDHLYET